MPDTNDSSTRPPEKPTAEQAFRAFIDELFGPPDRKPERSASNADLSWERTLSRSQKELQERGWKRSSSGRSICNSGSGGNGTPGSGVQRVTNATGQVAVAGTRVLPEILAQTCTPCT